MRARLIILLSCLPAISGCCFLGMGECGVAPDFVPLPLPMAATTQEGEFVGKVVDTGNFVILPNSANCISNPTAKRGGTFGQFKQTYSLKGSANINASLTQVFGAGADFSGASDVTISANNVQLESLSSGFMSTAVGSCEIPTPPGRNNAQYVNAAYLASTFSYQFTDSVGANVNGSVPLAAGAGNSITAGVAAITNAQGPGQAAASVPAPAAAAAGATAPANPIPPAPVVPVDNGVSGQITVNGSGGYTFTSSQPVYFEAELKPLSALTTEGTTWATYGENVPNQIPGASFYSFKVDKGSSNGNFVLTVAGGQSPVTVNLSLNAYGEFSLGTDVNYKVLIYKADDSRCAIQFYKVSTTSPPRSG